MRSRAKLLDAATELLTEGGSRAVTVDAVAERSGVAKSTMYRHFASQTELLVAVLRHNLPHLDFEVSDGSFEDDVRSVVHAIASLMTDPDWVRILPALMSLRMAIPDIDDLAKAEYDAQLGQIQRLVDKGIEAGLLPTDTDLITTMSLLAGPLMHITLNNDVERLTKLADEVAGRYIASCLHWSEPSADGMGAAQGQ
ncbi:MAG: TetR/AcrR family transcriptional regulator [Microthrixaceae bacterium]